MRGKALRMGMHSCACQGSAQGDHAGAYTGRGEYTSSNQLHTGKRKKIVNCKYSRWPAATSVIPRLVSTRSAGGRRAHRGHFCLPPLMMPSCFY